jgi:uncharacterized protein (TIGR02757 family)
MSSLKVILESTYTRYHHPEYLRLDPLLCVHGFTKDRDTEIAGLIAAVLAYGRAEIIIRNVQWVLEHLEKQPFDFTLNTSYKQKQKTLKSFVHRFNNGQDIALFFECIAESIKTYGTIEKMFISCLGNDTGNVKDGLSNFSDAMKQVAGTITKNVPASFNYLFPSPSSGSACKRLNMYLRWMVRKADGIDLGVWKTVSPANLIIPVDTHVAKLGRTLEFTKRTTADWRMAEEITAGLRRFDIADPVRFDFSLCRAGMISFRKEAA